jgi:FkbM family methyltransferase
VLLPERMIKRIMKKASIIATFVTHTIAMIARIIFGDYAYSKNRMIRIYVSLIFMAYQNNWRAKGKKKCLQGRFTKKIFKHQVKFTDYPQMITLVEEIFIDQIYRYKSTSINPVIVDCGSNIGLSILYFKTVFETCTVYGFEPHKETYGLLEQNVRNNGFNDVYIFNIALGGSDGHGTLYSNPLQTLNMTLKEKFGCFEKTMVDQVRIGRLTNYVHGDIDLLKIDVEGSEEEIIQELITSGKIYNVKNIIVEHHSRFLLHTINDFIRVIETCGFSVLRKKLNQNSGETILHFSRC